MKKQIALALAATLALSAAPVFAAEDVTVIKVGAETTSMPNSYLDENGELAGENIEVLKLIDELLPQYEFEYEPVLQEVILAGLDTGVYQIGAFNAFYNDERAEKYLFPELPVSGGIRGLILPSSVKDTILPGSREEILTQVAQNGLKVVPVASGDSSEALFAEFNETHEEQIDFEVGESVDVSTSIRYIAQGRYDTAQFLKSNYNAVNEEVDPDGETFFLNFNDGGFGTWILYAKDQQELVDAIDGAARQLYEDGTFAAISEKYYGENVFQYIDGFEYADVEPKADYE